MGTSDKPARSEAANNPGSENEMGGTSSWSKVAAQGLLAKSSAAAVDGEQSHHLALSEHWEFTATETVSECLWVMRDSPS